MDDGDDAGVAASSGSAAAQGSACPGIAAQDRAVAGLEGGGAANALPAGVFPHPGPAPQGEREEGAPEGGDLEARRALAKFMYEERNTPVADILRRCGLTMGQLRYWRDKEGWKERPPTGNRMVGWLGRRLLGLHARLLGRLEAEAAKAEFFDEGHVRALAALAAALPHLTVRRETMARQKSARASGKPAPKRETKNNDAGANRLDDPDWVRAELARRLDQIGKRREPSGGGGGVDG